MVVLYELTAQSCSYCTERSIESQDDSILIPLGFFSFFSLFPAKVVFFWYEESKIPVLLQALKQRISINMKILPRVSLVQITGKINPL